MGSSTFIQSSLLNQIIIPYSPKNEIASCLKRNKYPIAKNICQSIHYQGEGLGIHEQGILEPLHIKENPNCHDLGCIAHSQDVGIDIESYIPPFKSKHTHIPLHPFHPS